MFLYRREVLGASSVKACVWMFLDGAESLVVAKGDRLEIYQFEGSLECVGSMRLCSVIGDLGALRNGKLAVCFRETFCVCELSVSEEVAVPSFTYELSREKRRLSAKTGGDSAALCCGSALAVYRDEDVFELPEDRRLVVDYALVETERKTCSLYVAYDDNAIEKRHVDLSLKSLVTIWRTSSNPLLKFHLPYLMMPNRISRIDLESGAIACSIKLNGLAELEEDRTMNVVDSGYCVELDENVQTARVDHDTIVIFTKSSAWLLKDNSIKPLARLSCLASSCCDASTNGLVFLGSKTDDSLLLTYRDGHIKVSDSLFSLGAIADACFSVKSSHPWPFQRQLDPVVHNDLSEVVVCSTSGIVASLSSYIYLHPLSTISRVDHVVANDSRVFVVSEGSRVRTFAVDKNVLAEESVLTKAPMRGRVLAATSKDSFVCEESIQGVVLVSANSRGDGAIGLSAKNELFEIEPTFQLRQRNVQAASLSPSGGFCVLVDTIGLVTLYDSSWNAIYASTASLAQRPRRLSAPFQSSQGGVVHDVVFHRLSDGGRGIWAIVAIVDDELDVYVRKKNDSDFRRVLVRKTSATKLVPFVNVESRSGVFLDKAVVLFDRGVVRVVGMRQRVAFALGRSVAFFDDQKKDQLHFAVGFGNILLLGDVVAHKIYLGPKVVRGRRVVACNAETPPIYAVLVDADASSEQAGKKVKVVPEMKEMRRLIPNLPRERQTRSEVRLVAANNAVQKACHLLEDEVGVCMCRLVFNHRIFVVVGTRRGSTNEGERMRGRLLIFELSAVSLRLVVIKEMPGIVSCVSQLQTECLTVSVGPKLEIHHVSVVGAGARIQLRQLAQHHACGPFVNSLFCVKQYVFYSSPRGSRFLCWRPADKSVNEIGQHDSPSSHLAVIVRRQQLSAVVFSSRPRDSAWLKKRQPLNFQSGAPMHLTSPVVVSVAHPTGSNGDWASLLCCADGSMSSCVAVNENTYRTLTRIQRVFEKTDTADPLNGIVLSATQNLTKDTQKNLVSAVVHPFFTEDAGENSQSRRNADELEKTQKEIFSLESMATIF